MARTRVDIPLGELQDAINQLEAARLFSSPHKLYLALAETPWARSLGATWAVIYYRIKEANADPENPGITMRVKRARQVTPREPGDLANPRQPRTRRVKVAGGTFTGLTTLIEAFRNRGVEVAGIEQLITSSQKSLEENRAIMLAWADLRDKLGIPKPIKKTASLTKTGEVRVTETTESSVVVEPGFGDEGTVHPIEEYSGDEGAVHPIEEYSGDNSGTTVIEEMPDGAPVLSQEAENIESESESESSVVPVTAKPVPMSIQKVAVRPPMSRPSPIRSSVPPRPMPAS